MAVCAGLADSSKWPIIAKILEMKRPDGEMAKSEISIDRAMYGVRGDPGRQVDVRSKIQQLVDAGECAIRIDNEFAGLDPAGGVEKVLELEYRLNGKKEIRTIGEKRLCDLSRRESIGGQCGPYFERWALEALCVMGRQEGALLRMAHRYRDQIDASFSSLWEYLERAFDVRAGTDSINYVTLNHAWNVPNTILSRFIAGVAPESPGWMTYHVLPKEAFLTAVAVTVPTVQGQVAVSIDKTASQYRLSLTSPANTTAIVGIPKTPFSELRSIEANGMVVWNGSFTGNVAGLSCHDEDATYVTFTVKPGRWIFIGTGTLMLTTPKPAPVSKMAGVALNKKAWTVCASTDRKTFQAGPWGKISLQVDASSANAIDGDHWTGWRALGQDQAPGQWFIIDMKRSQRFDTIVMDNVWAIYDGPAGYAVSVSDDGIHWGNPVATGSGGSGGITTVACGDRTGRYIKIEQTGTKKRVWSIYEVDVYRSGN